MATASDWSEMEGRLERRLNKKARRRNFAPANRSAFTLKRLLSAPKKKRRSR